MGITNNSGRRESSTYASDTDALIIGIDLGTSRSGLAAANGLHRIVESYVGFPKDAVSLRHLKKNIVFGTEALENRLSVNLYRPLEKGVLKCSVNSTSEDTDDLAGNQRAATELIRHLVSVLEPDRDQKVYGVVGVPAQASINSKQALLEAAKDSMDAVMLVSQPFAVAYGLSLLDGSMIVDIGAGTIDICRMHGTMPEETDQVSVTFAGDHIDRNFGELITETYPQAQFTVNMLKKIKERHAFVAGEVERVKVSFPCNGRPTEFDVTTELKTASETIVKPICDGLQELIGSFDPEFQERLKSNIVLSGGGSQIIGLASKVQECLKDLGNVRVVAVEDPLYAGADGALNLALDMPDEYWQRLS